MNKKPRKLIVVTLLILMCALIFGSCSVTKTPPYTASPDNSYVVKNLDVTIDASKGDRSMQITESYVYNFSEIRHGFYRDFAINSGERIRDIKVSGLQGGNFSTNEYHVSHANSNVLRVRVGDEDKRVPTNTDLICTISYTMITPKVDKYPDALMINAIGQGFTSKIEKARVKIILPAQATNAEYYVGEWGESTSAGDKITETFNSDKTEFIISTTSDLPALNGLTVYYGMPSGTFSNYVDFQVYITLGIALAVIALAILLKILFGKSDTITPITNFYPPKRDFKTLNPVELGYLIDNTCSGDDVTSLIFYWASNGYLKIQNEQEDEDIRLLKIKNLPQDAPKYEVDFFNTMFNKRAEVLVSELTNKMYAQVAFAKTAVKSAYSGKLYSKKAKVAKYAVCAATCVFAFLTIFFAYLRVNSHYFNALAFVALVPIVLSNFFGVYIVNNWLKFDRRRVWLLIAFFAATSVSSLILFMFVNYDVVSIFEICALIAGVVIPSLIAPFIVKRTTYYTSELNEIMGFREFLMSAEKDKLEMLLKDNPEYYYDILPYANVLGVSDIWEKKFAGLTMQPPSYYMGDSVLFDMLMFNAFYRSAYRSMATTVVSQPGSSGRSGGGGFGGFGGGGGFSGGGFGGGGGGSW